MFRAMLDSFLYYYCLAEFMLWKVSESFALSLKCAVYVNPTQKNRKAIEKNNPKTKEKAAKRKGLIGENSSVLENTGNICLNRIH